VLKVLGFANTAVAPKGLPDGPPGNKKAAGAAE